MALKFCANLNFLFAENATPMLERFRLAKLAGFRAVENGFPVDVSVDDAVRVQKETGLEVVLINICTGLNLSNISRLSVTKIKMKTFPLRSSTRRRIRMHVYAR